ncbi:MAG: branched-chain amino acid ABC transporter permease [Magnetococcales bacterium]|nr:branched-chain amino acid ABC transporter permease [Magnetococcales bacterium]
MRIAEYSLSPSLFRLLLGVSISLPLALVLPYCFGNTAWGTDITRAAMIFALFTLSWDFLCGTTGEISFGHTFFIGASAYTAAVVQLYGGLSPFIALLMGTLVGALCGGILGVLTFRHTAAVYTMVTMAIQLSFHRTLFIASDFLGGEEGIPISSSLLETPQQEYWFTLAVSVGALLLAIHLWDTPFGRQLRASGGDNRVALASGVPVTRIRILGACFAGLLAGMGGALMAMLHRMAYHELAGDSLAGLIFLLATVGGVRTLLGPWLAALLYTSVVREFFQSFQAVSTILEFGLFLVIIWAFPNGFGQPVGNLWCRLRARKRNHEP